MNHAAIDKEVEKHGDIFGRAVEAEYISCLLVYIRIQRIHGHEQGAKLELGKLDKWTEQYEEEFLLIHIFILYFGVKAM